MSPLSQPNGRRFHRRGPAAEKAWSPEGVIILRTRRSVLSSHRCRSLLGRQRASSSSAHGDQYTQVIAVAVCLVARGRLHPPHTEIRPLKSSQSQPAWSPESVFILRTRRSVLSNHRSRSLRGRQRASSSSAHGDQSSQVMAVAVRTPRNELQCSNRNRKVWKMTK